METPSPKHTCLKLQLKEAQQPIYVKGTWFESRFDLSITDGLNAWICHASEEQVRDRAAQWDQPVSEYVALAERYLGFQHPDSAYGFADAGDGHKRLSWTFEKEGTKLEWRWKCQPSPNSKQTTAAVLDFLMDANVGLSEEVVRKTQSFERLKVEAEKCLALSEKLTNEKIEFESAIYAKFLGVLNSKKAKLRELRDKISKQEIAGKLPEEEEVSSDQTEPFVSGDEKSEDESLKDLPATSKDVPRTRSRGRGRKKAADN
ncbi:DNA repair protein XRCC4-like isoform X1 [Prunus avium]|uniref:DNA repair protein XRCC4-like isoform X1 n=1 Tax=Prunus avium TaxID=42229 RepID=A0A6P5RG97_PRUAV|nr:DNA repair protein XRCC4-like isoform X1 [Prunus avium]